MPGTPSILGAYPSHALGVHTAWLVHAGIPVFAPIDRLWPATGPEALAMQQLAVAHRFAPAPRGRQQGVRRCQRAGGVERH